MQINLAQPNLECLTIREIEILRWIANGSMDREIAQELYLSVNTIKWHNRQIYAKLGVGSRTQALAVALEKGLLEDQQPKVSAGIKINKYNLPTQFSPFVGREQEIKEIKQLLRSNRLVTLTGTAGVGKTRLALQVATELIGNDDFKNGIFFAELAPLRKSEQVKEALLAILGLTTPDIKFFFNIMEEYLYKKHLLLLIDNFEHVLDAASLVQRLLSFAPRLKVIITSREQLNLSGEKVYPVSPLTIPELGNKTSISSLQEYESVALFIQRAKAVKPNFYLAENDLVTVAEICARLDGLPLAIELAAAQLKFTEVKSLLQQLEDRFTALTDGPRDFPERHRTLQRSIEWSYELLDDLEKTLFYRLSVFQGGGTIDSIEMICCRYLPINALDGLDSLFNKNLIQQKEGLDGETRFIMLETIHDFARARLNESGEEEVVIRRHAEFFTALAEKAKYYTRGGPDTINWLRRLEADHRNIQAAYDWSMNGGDVILGLQMVGLLDYFWWRQVHFEEGKKWTTRALELIYEAPPKIQASVYSAAGMMSYLYGDRSSCKRMYKQALALFQELGYHREIGWAYTHLMMPSEGISDETEELKDNFNKGVTLLRDVGDKVGVCEALANLTCHEGMTGNPQKARQAAEESLEIAREIGDRYRESIDLLNLSECMLDEGDPVSAHEMWKASLRLSLEINRTTTIPGSLSSLAGIVLALGQPRRAVVLLGAADACYNLKGCWAGQSAQPVFERYYNDAREHLTESTYKEAWEEGQAMSPDKAIAYALDEP